MNKEIIFIGGVFAEENIDEITDKSRGTIEYSANIFQERLISGFKKNHINIKVISAPFIGAYPMRSKQIFFSKFKNYQDKFEYVPFCNIWGVRNFSRANSVKKKIKNYINKQDVSEKLIVVYSAHEPFLEAAAWAKKKNPNIKICFVVPDLPQFMNLDASKTRVYDWLKRVDIARMNKHMKMVDTFVLLTEQMKEVLKVGDRQVLIVEGIIDEPISKKIVCYENNNEIKYIVYTGKLNEKFGVKRLIDSFFNNFKEECYRLVLVGDGDCVPYINEMTKVDERIIYTGQVSPDEAMRWQEKADVLINPRNNNEEYTKYSFPSKTIEYLKTGKPVVAYMLDGMKEVYKDFLYILPDECEDLEMSIIKSAVDDKSKAEKYEKFIEYSGEYLYSKNIAKSIMELNKEHK